MTTKTLMTENTRTVNLNGSIYVRVPAYFARHLNIKDKDDLIIALAEGKKGQFLWVAKPKKPDKEE